MSQTRVQVAARSGPSRIINQPPPRGGGITRVQPVVMPVQGSVHKMHTGPRRITIVPDPLPKEVPPPKPKVPTKMSSVPERPKSRAAAKIPPVIPSHSSSQIPSRPPPVAESSRKGSEAQKPESTRSQPQTRTTKSSLTEKTKGASLAPPQSRARTMSNARPPSRMDLPKSTRPSSRADFTKPTRTGAATATKVADKRKRPEPQLATQGYKEAAVPIPSTPSPTLPPVSTTDSIPSLNLETEVKFVPPATMSPKKVTAETAVVHALKMGLPLLETPKNSPPPSPNVEDVLPRVVTPELVEEPEERAVEPAHEPAQVQEPMVQAAEQHDPNPDPVPAAEQPTNTLPVFVLPAAEPPMPLKVKGKERSNKVGDLVAHFEDARRKPARPPRMVEQTPISALVSTIRRGFEDMKPLPALEMVEEGDSVDMTPPPRPAGGLKVGGVKGLNVHSKLGLGERTALTAMQLNS